MLNQEKKREIQQHGAGSTAITNNESIHFKENIVC